MDPIRSTAELYARALAMELEAAQRYTDLALRMREGGDAALAELFWRLAREEGEHYAALIRRADAEGLVLPPAEAQAWAGAATDLALRLTTPRQALAMALEAERRAREFFALAAVTATDPAARELARDLAMEESGHIRALLEQMHRPEAEPARASDWDRLFIENAA